MATKVEQTHKLAQYLFDHYSSTGHAGSDLLNERPAVQKHWYLRAERIIKLLEEN